MTAFSMFFETPLLFFSSISQTPEKSSGAFGTFETEDGDGAAEGGGVGGAV